AKRAERSQTAHDLPRTLIGRSFPDRTRSLQVGRRASAVESRRRAYDKWLAHNVESAARIHLSDKHFHRDHNRDRGIEL
ncbi:MAG: hypothetical protein QOI39_74, partial [Mycobacterium sp.]|nr:hypothetical protein [Mycobacterium sp.]